MKKGRPRLGTRQSAAAALALGVLVFAACGAPQPGDDASARDANGAGATGEPAAIHLGVDVLLDERVASLRGARLGLITNHTGRTRDGRSTIDALHAHPDLQLVALFSPEHGIRGTALAGERIDHTMDDSTGLPVHSLYGATRAPTAEMLESVDVLLFDIQDIGARYYTYVWTLAHAMRAAAAHDRRIIVLDRPNPIGGALVQGNVLDPAFATFVGLYPVPMRHGMTVGEVARYVNAEFDIGARLDVIPLRGWTRAMEFDRTGLEWRAPSPSMPSLESALHYPGTCLFEGTNLSVGRGTPLAYQQIGAPWIDAPALARRLEALGLPGVRIETVRFTPDSPADDKHDGVEVAGLRFTAVDRARYDPTFTAVAVLAAIRALHGDSLRFLESHFDRLAGTDALRHALLRGEDASAITAGWPTQIEAFDVLRQRHLLYPGS